MNKENNTFESEETSTLAQEFDSKAFIDSDLEPETESDVNDVEDTTVDTVTTEIEAETDTETEESDDSDWAEISTPDADATDTDTTDDALDTTDESEETASEKEGWQDIAEAIGINADDYNTFIETLKGQQDLAAKGATNEKVLGLNKLVSLDDETLMREELNARGFSSHEVEDEIDIMIENNTIRSEARRVRKDLEGVISNEKERIATQSTEIDATQQEEIEAAAAELRDYMSKTTEMFGGRINTKQKEQHSTYIASGTFFDEISQSAETMAQAAWLWKYKDHIINGQKSAGVEKGKASILDKMQNPEPTRRTSIPDPQTGDFNPNRFMDSEQM
jgi:hypothetical protein